MFSQPNLLINSIDINLQPIFSYRSQRKESTINIYKRPILISTKYDLFTRVRENQASSLQAGTLLHGNVGRTGC